MNPKDKLSTGRLIAGARFRYFRAALLSLIPKETPGLGTFGVTRSGVLLWDPAIAAIWTEQEIAGVLVHEISHLLRKHDDRRERLQADPARWNKSADCEINDDLIAGKVALPSKPFEPCTPQGFSLPTGLSAEEYYRMLPRQPGQPQQPQQGQGESQDGQDGQGQGQGAAKKGQPHAGGGWCGSCAGNPLPGEGTQAQGRGRSEVEMDRMRRQTAEAIIQEASRGRGTVPGGWLRWANTELQPPKIRWQDKLSRVLRGSIAYRAGAVDLHYLRPSRRQAGLGYGPGRAVLPAFRAPVPEVSVVIDTSGSMSQAEMETGIGETAGILKTTGARCTFIACDSNVHSFRRVSRWQEAASLLKGGGGTNMQPALSMAQEARPRPDVIVVVTDGEIGNPGPAPKHSRVIWVLVGRHATPINCGYGEEIRVQE